MYPYCTQYCNITGYSRFEGQDYDALYDLFLALCAFIERGTVVVVVLDAVFQFQ